MTMTMVALEYRLTTRVLHPMTQSENNNTNSIANNVITEESL